VSSAPILIVDDSLTVRMDLAQTFESAGFRTLPCGTLAEARAVLSRERVALLILDVVLPDGDGLDFLHEVRAQPALASMPVLLLSTEAEVRDRIAGLQTGANDYVGKPYDTGYLVARAKELLQIGEAPTRRKTETILVIDDSATFREELRHVFEGAGYAVLTAASGEEGLRVAAVSRPTAVVVDGVMPGIDGGTVIRKIRMDAALRRMPCVLLTASEDADAELRALDAGADAFVRKDEDLEVILARIAAVLRGATALGEDTESLLGPKRIRAVDDSATYLHALADMLRQEGYEVIVARSGDDALEMLSVQTVDCILLDVLMPGLDGHETCRRIKASPVVRDIPLMMLTAVEERDAMLGGFGAGADDFISKTSDFDVLKARVRAQLRRKQFEDEHRRMREALMRSEVAASEERTARVLAETRAALVEQLERKNRELESFSYSVSHDLRAPLRSIDGFSRILLEDYGDRIDVQGGDYLKRIRAGAQRMAELIDDLLQLSRVSRSELVRSEVDLSALARTVLDELGRAEPERQVGLAIAQDLKARADPRLLRAMFENLFGNAWKFTSKTADARIELGSRQGSPAVEYFIRDNGAGFDPAHAKRLFAPFQRLHHQSEFAGTGIGLATAYRIVDRHGGRIWAEGVVGKGATFFFTLPSE
jgi:two-component system NtrC family sensor kinase